MFSLEKNIRGGDARLGDRVLKWVVSTLTNREGTLGSDKIIHDFTVVDPNDVFAADGALAERARDS